MLLNKNCTLPSNENKYQGIYLTKACKTFMDKIIKLS